jgi:hypothetical protein
MNYKLNIYFIQKYINLSVCYLDSKKFKESFQLFELIIKVKNK